MHPEEGRTIKSLSEEYDLMKENLKLRKELEEAKSDGSMRYNCIIIDLYDRSVIASVSGRNITAELAVQTLSKAITQHPWVLKNGVMPCRLPL